jgi:hypothetical protein
MKLILEIPKDKQELMSVKTLKKALKLVNPLLYLEKRTKLLFKADIFVKDGQESNFSSTNLMEVNFKRGTDLVGSITHEAFHLLLRQNDWLKLIKRADILTKKYNIFNTSEGKRPLYQVEQMIAYLIQSEVDIKVGRLFDNEALINYRNNEFFNLVLDEEYSYPEYPALRKLGETIHSNWKTFKEEDSLIKFIDSCLKDF